MKIGVIGLGIMGMHHVRVLSQLGHLAAVCDSRIEHAKEVGQLRKVPVYHGVSDIVKANLDGVIVATPTPMHCWVTEQCLRSGLDVLIEKPIAATETEANHLINLCQLYKSIVGIGYIERFNPAFKALNQIIKSGQAGDITSINIKRVGGIPRSANNIVLDLMTHDFNLLIEMTGGKNPEKIFSLTTKRNGIIDSAQTLLQFGDTSATCEANWISPIKIRKIQITGTNGYYEVDLIKQTVTSFSQSSQHIEQFNEEPLKAELEAFILAIQTRSSSGIVTDVEGLQTLNVTTEAMK